MEAFYILLAIFAICAFAKWFLMRPVGPVSVRSDLTPVTPSASIEPASPANTVETPSDLFEGKIISEFPEIDYSELDEPTFSRRNVSIFTLDDAALWFGSTIISMFDVIDYSQYESPTFIRKKIAAAKLRKERAQAAKLRKAAENNEFVSASSAPKTKRRIAQEFLEFHPAIIA